MQAILPPKNLDRRKILLGTILVAIVAAGTVLYTVPRVNQASAAGTSMLEPENLSEPVRMPGFNNNLTDITSPSQMTSIMLQMQSAGPGVGAILADAHNKFPNVQTSRLADNCQQTSSFTGYLPCTLSEAKVTDPANSFFDVFFLIAPIPYVNASITSAPTIMVAYQPSGASPYNLMAMYWHGNLVTTARERGVDPFIIINAMPYWFVTFHWYTWGGPIALWSYWWHDSHNHPNWFWGVYWWWRVYLNNYYPKIWSSWYWYWWNWVYWQNWDWWSTYFPYYCNYAAVNYCG